MTVGEFCWLDNEFSKAWLGHGDWISFSLVFLVVYFDAITVINDVKVYLKNEKLCYLHTLKFHDDIKHKSKPIWWALSYSWNNPYLADGRSFLQPSFSLPPFTKVKCFCSEIAHKTVMLQQVRPNYVSFSNIKFTSTLLKKLLYAKILTKEPFICLPNLKTHLGIRARWALLFLCCLP